MVKKIKGLLVVLENQTAVLDLKPLRADRRKTVDARGVAAIAAVGGDILGWIRLEQRLVLRADEVVIGALGGGLELRVALQGLSVGEVGHRIVSENGGPLLVFQHERFAVAGRVVAQGGTS